MNIGYACIPLKILNRTNRSFLLKNYTENLLINKIDSNLNDLLEILKYNTSKDIYLFRISSDIIPFGSHDINKFNWSNHFKDKLKNIGEFIFNNNIRVSMHPGQYTVINSINLNTVKKSIKDLEYHALFLDSLGVDDSCKIILHVGGIYNNKENAINNFINTYNELPLNIKNRLVIENDEKNYGINDLIYISNKCSIPIIYDNLHNYCFEGFIGDNYSILNSIKHTWNAKDGSLKLHYSEQNPKKKKGSHSYTINSKNFLNYISSLKDLDVDIMLEVKDKDFSAIKAVNLLKEFNCISNDKFKEDELNTYEFYLKEKSEYAFEKARFLLNTYGYIEFYEFIDSLIYSEIKDTNYIKTLKEVYLKLEPYLSLSESNHFNKIFKNNDLIKAKEYLYKICVKKDFKDMISMYYFYN